MDLYVSLSVYSDISTSIYVSIHSPRWLTSPSPLTCHVHLSSHSPTEVVYISFPFDMSCSFVLSFTHRGGLHLISLCHVMFICPLIQPPRLLTSHFHLTCHVHLSSHSPTEVSLLALQALPVGSLLCLQHERLAHATAADQHGAAENRELLFGVVVGWGESVESRIGK